KGSLGYPSGRPLARSGEHSIMAWPARCEKRWVGYMLPQHVITWSSDMDEAPKPLCLRLSRIAAQRIYPITSGCLAQLIGDGASNCLNSPAGLYVARRSPR